MPIIEFYLNKERRNIPPDIQKSIVRYLKHKNGILKQIDAIAVVTRAG